eukprot:CAMPEP_0170839110 /NCGR_PEP_ID=MMETSP0734-20130129/3799_1 /TAXON_ID=186038 /ORGANISM="Fragilariopsis kerguelensis, Strain L26-C5" /LENGTH=46 /DNA_ID= /DNA_START= /DNA_END= /DNA_ORIENTATION=
MKVYTKKREKFESDCQKAYLTVKGQCSPDIILDLVYHDDYEDIQDN